MVAKQTKQTEKTIYKTADKNTEDRNTQNAYTPDTKNKCDAQSHCRYFHAGLQKYESVIQFQI